MNFLSSLDLVVIFNCFIRFNHKKNVCFVTPHSSSIIGFLFVWRQIVKIALNKKQQPKSLTVISKYNIFLFQLLLIRFVHSFLSLLVRDIFFLSLSLLWFLQIFWKIFLVRKIKCLSRRQKKNQVPQMANKTTTTTTTMKQKNVTRFLFTIYYVCVLYFLSRCAALSFFRSSLVHRFSDYFLVWLFRKKRKKMKQESANYEKKIEWSKIDSMVLSLDCV